jgi:excisionase family DNA binding protein
MIPRNVRTMHDTAPASAEPEYYTVRQAVKPLGLKSAREVYELIKSGEIDAIQVRSVLRIRSDAVRTWLAAQPKDEDLCTIGEAARTLQLHERTITELIAEGEIKTVKKRGHRGRLIIRKSLDDYLKRAAVST